RWSSTPAPTPTRTSRTTAPCWTRRLKATRGARKGASVAGCRWWIGKRHTSTASRALRSGRSSAPHEQPFSLNLRVLAPLVSRDVLGGVRRLLVGARLRDVSRPCREELG